eukprot:gene64273-87910_t
MRMPDEFSELAEALRQTQELGYDSAWSMPKAYYTDPALVALEQEHLFAKEWICIGRTEEVAAPGDFMAFQLCDQPLLAVRGDDHVIRVMSNVCRHRGALLVEGRGRGKRIVCPYHHWSYDFEGKLAAAPRMELHETFDPALCRLPNYAVEEWHGFLFTCLDCIVRQATE